VFKSTFVAFVEMK